MEKVNVPNGVGEDRILFMKDGSALCLLRSENGTKNGLLGRAAPPFTDWTWRELGLRIGGPNMIELPLKVEAGQCYNRSAVGYSPPKRFNSYDFYTS